MPIKHKLTIYTKNRETTSGKQYTSHCARISRKDGEEWYNVFFTVRFTGEAAKAAPKAEGKHEFDVKDGYLTVDHYTGKDGLEKVIPVIVITEING